MQKVGVTSCMAVLSMILLGCAGLGFSKVTPDSLPGQSSAAPARNGVAESDLKRFEFSQRHMGVIVRLVLYAGDESEALGAVRAAFQRIADLDAILSDYRIDSELMRLVRAPVGQPFPIGPDLLAVLQHGQGLAEASGGAFDVTVGPLVGLWREARESGSMPDARLLAEARRRTGWRNLHIDPSEGTATLLVPGMRIDLGGIGKGYAADEALAVLRSHGVERALLEFGGDIVAGAPPPSADAWTVHVVGAAAGRDTVRLANAAVSTSGDTEQFVVIDGVRYSHVVDPRTGVGLTNALLVTVTAPTAVLADALSTMVAVLGPDIAEGLLAARYPEVTIHARQALHPELPGARPLDRPSGARNIIPGE